MSHILHILICLAMLGSALYVHTAKNPISSIIYLVLTFFLAGVSLIFYHMEYFGLLFIIIYVGAIAILFLFVVMMLNIKKYKTTGLINIFTFAFSYIQAGSKFIYSKIANHTALVKLVIISISFGAILGGAFYAFSFIVSIFHPYYGSIQIGRDLDLLFKIVNQVSGSLLASENIHEYNFLQINVFAQTLFNTHSFHVVLAGFILLVALIGVIALSHFQYIGSETQSSLDTQKRKSLVERSLSRGESFITFVNQK